MEKLKKLKKKLNILLICSFIIYGSAIEMTFNFFEVTLNLDNNVYIELQRNLTYSILVIGFLMIFLTVIIKDSLFNEMQQDCEEREKESKKINLENEKIHNKESKYDVLTGLNNKATIKAKIDEEILKNQKKIGGMLTICIDNINCINNKYGVDVGHKFILKTSQILDYFDQFDGLICRVSEDKFIVYLHGIGEEEEIITIFNQFYTYSEKFTIVTPDDVINKIKFSSGIALYPADGRNFDVLYRYSDFALHEAKTKQKGSLVKFDRNIYDKNIEDRLKINQS